MANKRETILNCGISHVSASIFSQDGTAVRLEKVGLQTLDYDYTNDTLWLDAVIEGLETLCSSLKIKGNARFIFPGSLLLTKTIRVPRVEKEKQDNVVTKRKVSGNEKIKVTNLSQQKADDQLLSLASVAGNFKGLL